MGRILSPRLLELQLARVARFPNIAVAAWIALACGGRSADVFTGPDGPPPALPSDRPRSPSPAAQPPVEAPLGAAPSQATSTPQAAPSPCPDAGVQVWDERNQQSDIDALAGCEELYGLMVTGPLDLRPLASLRRVGQGGLTLIGIESLAGFEGLAEVVSMLHIDASSSQDLKELSGLRSLRSLSLANTGATNLEVFRGVIGINDLVLRDNDFMQNLEGLAVEREMVGIYFSNNDVLSDIMALEGIEAVASFEIRDNPALERVPIFDRVTTLGGFILEGRSKLRAAPDFPQLTSAGWISFFNTSTLEHASGFARVELADSIDITGNVDLNQLDLGQLRQADAYLMVYNNPKLDGAALASSLSGVSSSLHRVAPDQTGSTQNPCPWITDEVCDASSLCAPGTDPVCPPSL